MLSEKDLRDIFPHYKENKYKGIDSIKFNVIFIVIKVHQILHYTLF